MRRLRLSVAALPFFLITASPSQKPADGPVFASGTTYVEVPVIVQRSGKHLSGLKKQDFVVRQDGRDQTIANFEEVHRGGGTVTSSVESQSAAVARPAPSQITIIAIDMVNTPNLDRAYFTNEFERYLTKTAGLSGPVALVAIERGGIKVLREFTTDPRLLLSAISKDGTTQPTAHNEPVQATRQFSDQILSQSQTQLANSGGGDMSAVDALKLRSADEAMTRFQDRTSRIDTQLAIQQLAQSLKGIPGRKSLLLVGSGFKFIDSKVVLKTIGDGSSSLDYSVQNGGETLNQAAYTWKLLNDADVAVYPIDTRRTVNTAFQTMDTSGGNTPSALSFEQNQQADRDVLNSFKLIAASTGGKPCFYRTDLDNCVREAVDDDHDYYLLGFYVDKHSDKPGWHKIEVKFNDKANLRYRQGFMVAKFNPEAQRKTDIGLALNSPFAYTALPFTGTFEQPTAKGTKFNLEIPPNGVTVDPQTGKLDFDVVVIARSAGGKEAAHFNQHIQRTLPKEGIADVQRMGIAYTNRIEVPSGDYGVWFVVRDNLTGRTGSAVVPLKAP